MTDQQIQIVTAGCVTVALALLQIFNSRHTRRTFRRELAHRSDEVVTAAKTAFDAANDTNSKFLALNETYRRHRDAQRQMEDEFRRELAKLHPKVTKRK